MARVIVVFGGGGLKGLAHIGAWRALEEAGVEASEFIGTSIGSLIAASIGGGVTVAELEERALALTRKDIVVFNRWALLVNGVKQPSLFRDEPFREYIANALPVNRFDELKVPVGANAVDLETGEEVWFGAGGRMDVPLADAVYASCALPVFYPPAQVGGRYYVDGGVAETLPVRRAAERGADLVIAVNVAAGGVKAAQETIGKGMIAVSHRAYDIMAHARREEVRRSWSGPPIVWVRPRLNGYATFDFDSTQYFLDEGYQAMRAAWHAYQQVVEQKLTAHPPQRPSRPSLGRLRALARRLRGGAGD
ncbi:MAG: patatin-like phospholipase family protein [Gemmatimonadota bacterium]|jgi:NTE family protein